MRRLRLLGAVLGLMLLAAGCLRIPTTGPVQYAEPSPTSGESPPVQVVAEDPGPGDSPSQIVHGFLEAMRSYHAGFPVARKFLAPAVRELWDPATIEVYESDSGLSVTPAKSRRVVVEASQAGEIRADGSWRSATAGTDLRIAFRLARVHGEWRITNPPNALVMSRDDLDREYGRYELYFFDPTFRVLVPDAVYLPVRGNIATLLVQSLLRGPSSWLGAVARTAFPTRSQLAAPSVPIEGDVAQVDLGSRVLELSNQQRQLMAAQLAWTLQQVGVQRVQISVDQAPLTIAGRRVVATVNRWERYDPAVAGASTMAVGVAGKRVLVLGSVGASLVDGPLGSGRVPVRSVAVSMSGNRFAAVSADGRRLLVAGAPDSGAGSRPRVPARGQDLLEPSWDRTGKLWFVDRGADAATIKVLGRSGRVRQLHAVGLQGADVRALKVSRDGARLAALVAADGRTSLMVARIRREPRLLVDGVHRVPLPLTTMTDLAWSDVDELTVVGRSGNKPPETVAVSSDGAMVTELGSAPPARTIAAAPGLPRLLGGADGRIYRENEQYRWVALGRGGRPAYPG